MRRYRVGEGAECSEYERKSSPDEAVPEQDGRGRGAPRPCGGAELDALEIVRAREVDGADEECGDGRRERGRGYQSLAPAMRPRGQGRERDHGPHGPAP